MTKRPQDHFGHKAKQQGYPARSVYKLEEIDKRVQLLKRGQRVLDLGAAPGSWTLYAADKVGPQGKVVGIDLNDARIGLPPHASFVVMDIFKLDLAALGGAGSYDVVLSDMAPHTSGNKVRDQFGSHELYMRALEIAQLVLAPGGAFVGKIFQGADFELARKATAQAFQKARVFKPEASRSESYEIFLGGFGFKGAREIAT